MSDRGAQWLTIPLSIDKWLVSASWSNLGYHLKSLQSADKYLYISWGLPSFNDNNFKSRLFLTDFYQQTHHTTYSIIGKGHVSEVRDIYFESVDSFLYCAKNQMFVVGCNNEWMNISAWQVCLLLLNKMNFIDSQQFFQPLTDCKSEINKSTSNQLMSSVYHKTNIFSSILEVMEAFWSIRRHLL